MASSNGRRSPAPGASSSSSSNGQQQQQLLSLFLQVLRILLWPLHRLSQLVFPPSEFDGLSAAVAAKAGQQFVAYLSGVQERILKATTDPAEVPPNVAEVFQASGFAALRQEAVQLHALLLVYIHSPLHPGAERFCRQVLCSTHILKFCQEGNVLALGVSVATAAGNHLSQTLQVTAWPCLALVHPSSSSVTLLYRAQGPTLLDLMTTANHNNSAAVDALLPAFREALTQHQSAVAESVSRQLQREEEAALRQSQDDEYQQALAADQERQRAAREVVNAETARRQAEELRVAEEAARVEQAEQEVMAKAMSLVQPAPPHGGANVRFVLPSGAKLNRRFGEKETVAALKAFLFLHFKEKDIAITNIGLSTNFPRHSYTAEEECKTLEEAGLTPQAVLMVQDLDA